MVSGVFQSYCVGRRIPGHCRKKCTSGRSIFLRAHGHPNAHTEPDPNTKCDPHANCYTDGYTNAQCDTISNSNSNTHSYTKCNTDSKAYADAEVSPNSETSAYSPRLSHQHVLNCNLTDETQIQFSIRLF